MTDHAISKPNSNGDLSTTAVQPPSDRRRHWERLRWQQERLKAEQSSIQTQLKKLTGFLEIADDVTDALDSLSQKLFEQVLGILETKLSIAIQEVLEQPVYFRADANFRRGAANVDFSVERDGNREDVNRGQGGSVQNILSVGLRLFALARLDEEEHRRFLVLDEQDCWLRPELVPRLVHIVYRAARELNFQVIMISHHDVKLFEEYADKIYQLTPQGDQVVAEPVVEFDN